MSIHEGHRQRVIKEYLDMGIDHFPDHKVLEALMYFSIPRRDTNPIGHALVERFGSISGVLDASYEMLLEVEGVTERSAQLIRLVSGIIRAYMDDFTRQNNRISDYTTAKEYMRYKFLCLQTECIYMACLGANGKVIYCDCIAEGSPETVSVSPALVVKTALRANAAQVLLAHNHPNGICLPSSRDLGTTSILFEELARVDIDLCDHIIVAPDGVYSMKENGMFPSPQLR